MLINVLFGDVLKVSVAWMVKVLVVAEVAVPEIKPLLELSESPAGNAPLATEKLKVPWLPVAETVCE